MRYWRTYMLTFGVLVWVLTYNLWHYFGVNVYYQGNAFIILISSIYIHSKACCKTKKLVSGLFLILSANNMLDELSGRATHFHYAEFIVVGVYIFYFWLRLYDYTDLIKLKIKKWIGLKK